jgi:glycolate oxidase FAD binding subunit
VVVLDLTGMTGVVRHEPGDLTIRLRPGTTLPQVRELLLPHGQTLPLEPPGWLRATVGGVMAGDAWGPSRLGYGGPRDVVLGLRVVDGAGRVFQTGGHVVKNVSGLDLGKLFVGSFGTLGVVVEVSCKLRPRAARRALWALPPVDAAAAWEGVGAIASGAFQPLAMVVAGAAERPRIFVVVEGGAAEVAAQLAELLAGYGPGVRARVRDLDPAGPPRGDAGEELGGAFDPEADRPALLLRCEVPEAQLQGLWRRLGSPSAPGPLHGVDGAELVAWVGLGVLWVRVPRAAAAATAALTAAVRAQAEEAGGRAVAVTDAPALAAGVDPWGNPGDLLPWFRRLKQRFDPDDVLAPGRFVGGI